MPQRGVPRRPKQKSHAPGHAPRFGKRASVAQPRGPVVSLPNTLTEIERRDYLASTDNDHSEAKYEEANFRQTGIRSVGLLYDTKSE